MFNVIKTLSLSALLASGMLLWGQDAMAFGRRRPCRQGATYATTYYVAPANQTTSIQAPMNGVGQVQTSPRLQYQSAFQAPAVQPQYYAPAPVHVHRQPVSNQLPKADPRRYSSD